LYDFGQTAIKYLSGVNQHRQTTRTNTVSDVIMCSDNSFLGGAVRAAKVGSSRFNAMAYDPASAMFTRWSKRMNRAFKAIKIVGNAIHHYLQVLIIFVSACFTLRHKYPFSLG
jgi:hypothetical protein